MHRSLIVGGTRGLGLALARISLQKGIEPIILGQPRPDRTSTIEVDGQPVRFEPVRIEDDADVARCIDRFKVTPSLNFKEVFYLPGVRLQGRFWNQSPEEIRRAFDVTLFGLMNFVWHFHPMKKKPYRLITIASSTSWRIRPNEAVYGAAKSGEAQFARNIHQEIAKELPGSRSLIVHPGGMQTEFWNDSGVDTSKFMSPDDVARIIWDEMDDQDVGAFPDLHELHIVRGADGSPSIMRGPTSPNAHPL